MHPKVQNAIIALTKEALMVEMLANPVLHLTQRLLSKMPNFAAAFLFLLVGLFVARALRTIAERLLDRTRLDEHTGTIGINEVLARLGLGKSPTYVVSFLIYWFILLAFFISAANAVDLTVVSELLERFMLFLPSLIAAVLMLFVGLFLARFVSEVVANAASANNIQGGTALAKCSSAAVVVFTALMALEQLGIRTSLVARSLQIVFASLGLAFAIAFGLGGKAIAEEVLREILNRRDK